MYAMDFEFDGERLSDYGLIIGSINGTNNEVVASGAEITFNQQKPSGSNNFNLYSSDYEQPLTTTFQVVVNPCKKIDYQLTSDEISAIQYWLCRKSYRKFKIIQDDCYHIYWMGTFSSKQIELNGKVIGLELTLHTNAPYAFMEEVNLEYDCSVDKEFILYDTSNEEGFICPRVEISILEDGDFVMTNNKDKHQTHIKQCSAGELITLDGKNQIIFSDKESHDLSNDFNYYFPKIINTYTYGNANMSNNIYTVNLECMINIIYSPIKKVGF